MPISDLMNTLPRLIVVALIATVSLSSPSWADTPIVNDSEAAQHIGQNLAVESIVTVVSTSRKGNTFINFGGVTLKLLAILI